MLPKTYATIDDKVTFLSIQSISKRQTQPNILFLMQRPVNNSRFQQNFRATENVIYAIFVTHFSIL